MTSASNSVPHDNHAGAHRDLGGEFSHERGVLARAWRRRDAVQLGVEERGGLHVARVRGVRGVEEDGLREALGRRPEERARARPRIFRKCVSQLQDLVREPIGKLAARERDAVLKSRAARRREVVEDRLQVGPRGLVRRAVRFGRVLGGVIQVRIDLCREGANSPDAQRQSTARQRTDRQGLTAAHRPFEPSRRASNRQEEPSEAHPSGAAQARPQTRSAPT